MCKNPPYREEGMRSLLANCKYRAFYSANDMRTAEVMANMMGETIRVNESYSDRRTDGHGSDGSGTTRGERTDRAMTPSEAMNLPKDEVILQFDKKIGVVQRLNIIPKLKNGEYSNTPPPKRRWSRKRELTVWKLSDEDARQPSGRPTEDEITRGNLELIANCTTIEQLKHLWKVTGKPKSETEREAYRVRVEELKGNIGVSSGREAVSEKIMQPESKEDRRTDDDFF